MIPNSSKLAAAALCVAAAVGCGGQGAQSGGAKDPGAKAAEGTGATASNFTGRDVEGKTFELKKHLGKDVILLNFWATWCEPCLAEFPHLRRLQDTHKAKGFVVVGVAMDGPETSANVPAFTKRNMINFPVVVDDDSHISALFNPNKSAPLSVIIDRSGKIVSIREGYNPGDEDFLAADVANVLDGKPPSK